MKEITYENLVPKLLSAVPEFHPDDEDVSEQLVHLVFGDFTRYVISRLEVETNDESIRRIFSLIEEAASSRDIRVRDAIRDSFLEGLADSPAHLDQAKQYMGNKTIKLLEEAKRYLKD